MLEQVRCGCIAVAFFLFAATGCHEGPANRDNDSGTEPVSDGRVTIDSNSVSLSEHVAEKDEPVPVQPAGAPNMLVVTPDLMYRLTLVAEVVPAQIDGVELQATAVAIHDSKAVVSYNTAGTSAQGAVDVFVIDADKRLSLTSRATFVDSDVHAVGTYGGKVYLATSTADESFGTPAVLEALSLSEDGALTLDDHVRVGLSSYAVTSVGFADGRVFATSGNTGGVWSFDPVAGAVEKNVALSDARWVAAGEAGTVVAVAGTPGRVAVLSSDALADVADFTFDGAQIAESKSTVEVLGGKAFIAGGPGGAIVLDLASGNTIAQVPVPVGLPFAPSEMVTNAVSVDKDLMFVSNGSAGVFLVTSSQDLAEPFDAAAPPTFTSAGRLVFPNEIASVNHIAYKDGLLFVAAGRGGLKVVRVERVVVPYEPPTAYPYISSFDAHTLRSGWTFDGSWGWGSPDGARTGKSGAFIDNDPTESDIAGADSTATLDVALTIPAEGDPLLAFWYGLELAAGDKVELQIDDGRGYETVATFDGDFARPGVTRFVQSLDAYRGATIHVRFRQVMGPASGPRRFTVDDVHIAESDLPLFGWPFETSFDSEIERSGWNLAGAWLWSSGDSFDGGSVLDGAFADDVANGQVAELAGWVPVRDGDGPPPVIGYWYRSALGTGDVVRVEVECREEGGWHALTTFTQSIDHDGWSYAEAALDQYAGKHVRFRVALAFPGSGDRTFMLDSVRVGPLGGESRDFPSTSTFDGDTSGWVTSGMLALEGGDSGGAIVAEASAGPGREGALQLLDFVTVPEIGPALVQFNARFGLADPSDRIALTAQTADGERHELAAWTGSEAHDAWTRYEVGLDALRGESLRVRFDISYGGAAGERRVLIDDVVIGGLPEARHAYPYAATAGDLASWSLTGAWQIADDDVLDANPADAPQSGQGEGHIATMDGFVQLPVSGRPTLFADVDLFLTDASDVVTLELQDADSGEWQVLRSYTSKVNREDFGWDEVSLDAWAGKAVRVRLCYRYGHGVGARTLALGGLRFEDLALKGFGYPWANGFEGRQIDQWNLWGAWRPRADVGSARPAEGSAFLDGNPEAVAQQDFADLQTATMSGEIMVPANAPSWLELKHMFGAVDPDDSLALEVQLSDSTTWATLALLGEQHAHERYSALELGLDAYRGKSIRLRLVMKLGASSAVRAIGIDDLRVGPISRPVHAGSFVVEGDFDKADWDLHGSWGVANDRLDANPEGRDMGGYDGLHTATLGSWVDISAVEFPHVQVGYRLELSDPADRAYIEVQPDNSAQWFTVGTLKPVDNTSAGMQSYSLSAWSRPVRVRARIAPSKMSGVRHFEIKRLVVGVYSD